MGGLTGEQLSLLREWEDEQRCAFEFFSKDTRPAERCVEEPMSWSRYCEDHAPEPDYDSIQKDRAYGHDD